MKPLKFWLIYLITYLKRRKIHILVALVSLLIIFFGALLFKDQFLKNPISEGIVGTYTEDDLPDLATILMSESLVVIAKDGTAKPKLLESWNISEDGKTYTLKLKNNKYWLDGTKIKASDIELPIQDIKATVVDDQTLQVQIADSFSPFLILLDKPVFKRGSNKLGTGPYRITQIIKDQVFIKKLVLRSDINKNDLVIRFYPNEKIAKNALKLGEISSLLGVNDLTDLIDKPFRVFSKTNYQQIVTIFYNTKDPILSDENFRKALGFAAPSIKGEIEAKTSIPPTSWAFNSDVKDYLDNNDQAKSSLDKVKNGKDSTITLTATTFLQGTGEKIVEAWNKQGIKAVLRVESGIPQNFQALLIAQNIPADPDQYSLWHSTQKETNISKISSPRIDKDLEDGRKTIDQEVRKARYADFQRVLLDQEPATFLYFPKYNVVYLKKIEAPLKEILKLQLGEN